MSPERASHPETPSHPSWPTVTLPFAHNLNGVEKVAPNPYPSHSPPHPYNKRVVHAPSAGTRAAAAAVHATLLLNAVAHVRFRGNTAASASSIPTTTSTISSRLSQRLRGKSWDSQRDHRPWPSCRCIVIAAPPDTPLGVATTAPSSSRRCWKTRSEEHTSELQSQR